MRRLTPEEEARLARWDQEQRDLVAGMEPAVMRGPPAPPETLPMRGPPAPPELLSIDAEGPPTIRTEREALAARGESPGRVQVTLGDVTELSRTPKDAPSPGGIPAQVAQFVMKAAGRKPMQPQAGAEAELSPFAPKGSSEDEKLAKALEFARKRANFDELGLGLAEQLAIANGKYDPARFKAARDRAQAPVTEAEAKIEAAKRFVQEKMERDRRFAQQETENERADRAERRQAGLDAQAAEDRKADRARQGELDALNKRKAEAEIGRLERQGRGGGAKAKDPLVEEKRRLEIQKLRQELAAGGAGGDDPTLRVPGYERTEGAPGISKKEAEEMRDGVAARQKMDALIADMKTFKKSSGRQWMPGSEEVADSEARATALVLALKEMEKTGALDAGTVEIAQGLIPGKWDDAGRSEKKLAVLEKLVNERMSGMATAKGYRPVQTEHPTSLDTPPNKPATSDDLNALFGKR